jgi:hypothetical protein
VYTPNGARRLHLTGNLGFIRHLVFRNASRFRAAAHSQASLAQRMLVVMRASKSCWLRQIDIYSHWGAISLN